MQINRGSPAGSLDELVRQLAKGAQQITYNMVSVQEEISSLRDAVEASTKRKSRKRRFVQAEETLAVGEVSDLIAAKESGDRDDGDEPSKRVCAARHCRRCGETGHNSRTRKVEIVDAEDSDESE